MPLNKNFDYAEIPEDVGTGVAKLEDIGMRASKIETIDSALFNWIKSDLRPQAVTNKGFSEVPVIWVAPERAFQIKNKKELRDELGNLKLPIITVERTGISKDPTRKGGFQAQLYSPNNPGRPGRFILSKKIKQDKTRNFASADAARHSARQSPTGSIQQNFPRINKKIVIQTVSIPIPVYVNVEYKVTIETEYQTQMNNLTTPFITRPGQINSIILHRDNHVYEMFIDESYAHSNNTSNLGEDNRSFKTEITIRVLGYLIGDGEDEDRPIVRIQENIVEIRMPTERVISGDYDDSLDPEKDFPRDYGIFSKS
tara:strand:- start:1033 stop:1971 length:939 start_codon:yes stop_codon:yes gene_type:complete